MNLIKLILCACCVLFTGNFEVDSYDLVELNKVGENRGNSCDQKEPLRRLRRDVAPPSEGQTSLVFIFDDTGSMHDDLKELRKGAKKITQEFANRENNPIYDYILVRFNDPIVRPTIKVNKASKMLEALDKITIEGGGDCPELAMQGIINGMNEALPKSHVFVFSDASAKDHALLNNATKIAQDKQITVTLLITGHHCHPLKDYDAYTELARRTHGQVYNMAKKDVEDVVGSIVEVLDTGLVPIESVYSETGGTHDFDIHVDSSMKKISATVSGEHPKIDVYDPHKELSKDVKKVLDLEKVKMVKVDDPEVGKWGVKTSSTSPHSIKISGTSDILVRYGFSFIVPEEFSDTAPSPIKDITNYLSVFVWKNKRNHTFTHAELVIVTPKMEKSHSNHTLRILDPSNCDPDLCIHVTTPFVPPLDTFKIYVRGLDSDGNAVKYLVSTNINAVEGDELKPKVKITEKEVKVKEGDNVQLICKVSSLKRAEISWVFEDEVVKDSSRRRVNFKRNDTAHLDFYGVTLDDMGSYFCRAKNPYGQHHEKVSLLVDPIPWEIDMVQKNMQAIENEADFEIKCTITPEGRVMPVQWLFNGAPLSDSVNFTVTGRTLKFYTVNRKHDGTYTCIGTHNEISQNSTGYLKVLYQPEILGPLLEEHVVKFDDRIVLNCTADGNPKPTIKWTQESGEISNSIIERFTPSHYGSHICEASNGVGKPAKKYVVLKTKYGLKPKVRMDRVEVSVSEDEGVELTCEVVSAKPVKVSWKFNDELVTPKDESLQITSVGDMHFLKIPRAELEHAGDYTCAAENFNGTDDGKVLLRVRELPLDIRMAEPNMEVLEDTKYEIECIVSPAKRKLNLKWLFGDRVLHNSDEFQMVGHSLLLKRVNRRNAGNYTCTGEFYGKTKSSTGYLNVSFKPEIIGPVKEKHIVEFGAKINLNCTAIGNPEPEITWFREDGSEANGTIEKFSPSDYGNHICEAFNGVGIPALKVVFVDSKAAKKPELIHSDYYHEVRTGQNLTLKCGCEQCGPILYKSWSRVATDNQTEITGVEGVLEEDTKNYNFDLKLVNTKSSDTSRYMCTIANEYGIVRETMRVEVLEEPTIIEILPHGAESVTNGLVKVKRGKEVMLTCMVLGSPTPVVRWYKNGRKIPPASNFMENTIKFEPAIEYDIGKYTCMATNKLGSASKDVSLHVIHSNLPMKTIMITEEGQTISLTCESQNLVFNDQPLDVADRRFHLIENNVVFVAAYQDSGIYKCITYNEGIETEIETVLIVQGRIGENYLNVGSYMISGNYTCVAKNVEGEDASSIQITSQGPPLLSPGSHLTKHHFEEYSDISLLCPYSYATDVTWIKDGVEFSGSPSGDVELYNKVFARPEDSGTYTCVAWNRFGDRNFTQKVTVFPTFDPYVNGDSYNDIKRGLVGHDLTLDCPSAGDYAPRTKWIHNGRIISMRNQLTLANLKFNDTGKYECKDVEEYGLVNRIFFVLVSGPPESQMPATNWLAVKEGELVELECLVYGEPIPKITWQRNNKTIDENDTILVSNASTEMAGEYKCSASNEYGTVEILHHVEILRKPKVKVLNNNLKIRATDDISLNCVAEGNPLPTVIWTLNGIKLLGSDVKLKIPRSGYQSIALDGKNVIPTPANANFIRGKLTYSKAKAILTIQLKDKRKEAGTFICHAINALGSEQSEATVDIIEPPLLLKDELASEITILAGLPLFLPCPWKGDPQTAVKWQKNSAPFYKGVSHDQGILSIGVTTVADSGRYSCSATNIGGEATKTFVVKVHGPPFYEINPANYDIILKCPPIADEAGHIIWEEMLLEDEANETNVLSENSEDLIISHDLPASIYTCYHENSAPGENPKKLEVQLLQTLPVEYYETKRVVNVGDTISMYCPLVLENPKTRVYWFKSGLRIMKVAGQFFSKNGAVLNIRSVSRESEGTYKCRTGPGKMERGVVLRTKRGTPGWSNWSTWTPCTRSCGKGMKTRTRKCFAPNGEYVESDGRFCAGESIEMEACNDFTCPVSGGWGDWSDWSYCPAKCWDSTLEPKPMRQKTRTCNSPPPSMGGQLCLGAVKEETECSIEPCRIDGGWSSWSSWSACSVSCGVGIRTRERTCNNPPPQFGGKRCMGTSTEREPCRHEDCPISPGISHITEGTPVDGGWSAWSEWGSCSVSCGNGWKVRQRSCTNPSPRDGGRPCFGRKMETEVCAERACSDGIGFDTRMSL
ncbi:hemicentin-1-like isoform X2 [Hermetia illucens]|uniref:hemicentin-1-like isoform X2 n=1 Tax=Hermetia illucens TaxID=343691 RepID=UPI0018CC3E03|nr:hemicentin-1-like isoform X2 [Hermetia illucens]